MEMKIIGKEEEKELIKDITSEEEAIELIKIKYKGNNDMERKIIGKEKEKELIKEGLREAEHGICQDIKVMREGCEEVEWIYLHFL